jgi:hypothetical protein
MQEDNKIKNPERWVCSYCIEKSYKKPKSPSGGAYWNDFHYFDEDGEGVINLEVCFNSEGFMHFSLETETNGDFHDKNALIKLRDFLNTLEL